MISYLSLGSNLGDRRLYMEKARQAIEALEATKLLAQTEVIETKAWGRRDQPDFLNSILKVDTELSAWQLLSHCLQIEENLGRKRTIKWCARVIDIDILLYGDEVIDSERLTIPHPGLTERKYLLNLMMKLDANLLHPREGKTIKELYKEASCEN